MKKKEENVIKEQETQAMVTRGKEQIVEEYKKNLPKYLDAQLEELGKKLACTEEMQGIPLIEINEIIRAKNFYGQSMKYNASELSMVFAYYRQAMTEINKYTKYIPTKENFCAFARHQFCNI